MIAYEKVALSDRPDWLVVVGDVNSTAACAMVAAKLRFPVVHLEAGLRSRDRDMPEEVNRLVTDVLSDVLWTPSQDADANLAAEGVAGGRITRVGNIMLDSFEMVRPMIEAAGAAAELGLEKNGFGLVTLHRPSNVDDPAQLLALVESLVRVQRRLPLVFPVHPRTAERLASANLCARLEAAGVKLIAPSPYIRFMSLVTEAAAVITDSGGVQEETTYLGIPCLTLRENTERPITVTEGTNRLVCASTLEAELAGAMSRSPGDLVRPELWDGKAAQRCLQDLRARSQRTGIASSPNSFEPAPLPVAAAR
jgi:UDP-N-acetylglucosamine 2-epimerase (non-hydrolysing)